MSDTFTCQERAVVVKLVATRWARLATLTCAPAETSNCPYWRPPLGVLWSAELPKGRARRAQLNAERALLAKTLFKLGVENLPELNPADVMSEFKHPNSGRTYSRWRGNIAEQWQEQAVESIMRDGLVVRAA